MTCFLVANLRDLDGLIDMDIAIMPNDDLGHWNLKPVNFISPSKDVVEGRVVEYGPESVHRRYEGAAPMFIRRIDRRSCDVPGKKESKTKWCRNLPWEGWF